MTVENTQIPDKIRKTPCKGRVKARISGDTRHNRKERETVSRIKNKNKGLLPSLKVNVVYVREETPAEGTEAIEWFLMTSEEVASDGAAYDKVEQYIRRWKTGRFHYVLKSGCKTGKLR